ncbi:MAG: hypothetical protein U5J62_08835 [Desulfurivibrio sp.]|nr:hypothetical protein [Desulfurivibrio sp.]
MNRQIAWMAENHVAATLLLLLVAIGGLVLALAVKQEVFPGDQPWTGLPSRSAIPAPAPRKSRKGSSSRSRKGLPGSTASARSWPPPARTGAR